MVRYDSSKIDELNGNAVFYNVSLQSDSARKKIMESTDSLPPVLYFITAGEVGIQGVNVAGLLQQQFVSAKSILIRKPIIQIIKTNNTETKLFSSEDSNALYKRLLGKFSSISTKSISIEDGILLITDRQGKPVSTIDKININLNNFQVDSRHNYENIISYFIKDIKISIGDIQFPESKDSLQINISGFNYDAVQKKIFLKEATQYRKGNIQPLSSLKNISITGLNTDAFIHAQKIQAHSLTCDGGLITIQRMAEQTKNSNGKTITFSSAMIDNIQLQSIALGETKILIKNISKEQPLILDKVTFSADSLRLTQGKTINELIYGANWKISTADFSFKTSDGLYEISSGIIHADNKARNATIGHITVKPLLSEDQFAAQLRYQKDRYDLQFNNIEMKEINFRKLFAENILEAGYITFQPLINIYNDRTVAPNPASKIGNYPHQLLQKLNFPLNIQKMIIKGGKVSYTEKAKQSKLKGKLFFSNVDAEISNLTNIPANIQLNHFMKLEATGFLLGTGKLHTTWQLPLSSGNNMFTVSGALGNMNALALNPLIRPLAMATVQSGTIHKLDFTLTGNDYKASGDVKFLYDELKIALLKKTPDSLKEKDVATALLNTFIKNKNIGSASRNTEVSYNRDPNRSFFNLLWKSIYSGIKKVAL